MSAAYGRDVRTSLPRSRSAAPVAALPRGRIAAGSQGREGPREARQMRHAPRPPTGLPRHWRPAATRPNRPPPCAIAVPVTLSSGRDWLSALSPEPAPFRGRSRCRAVSRSSACGGRSPVPWACQSHVVRYPALFLDCRSRPHPEIDLRTTDGPGPWPFIGSIPGESWRAAPQFSAGKCTGRNKTTLQRGEIMPLFQAVSLRPPLLRSNGDTGR